MPLICNRANLNSGRPAERHLTHSAVRGDLKAGLRGGICVFSLRAFNLNAGPWTPSPGAAPDADCIKLTPSVSIIMSACFLFRCYASSRAIRFYSVSAVRNRLTRGRNSRSRHHPTAGRLTCVVNAAGGSMSRSRIARTAVNADDLDIHHPAGIRS